jgi:membrane carboxypeptidase/penicillin-binding protein PbpC
VSWLLDGRLVATSHAGEALELPLPGAGERMLVAVDRTGRYDRVAVRVLR